MTQQGWIWVSVGVIAALTITLGVLVRRLGSSAGATTASRLLLDGTFGLYLGWVSVATCANVTAALVSSGVRPGAAVAQGAAVVVLAVAAGVGVLLARQLGGRYAVAAAMAWGLGWIAVGRVTTGPTSVVTAVAAGVAAAVVLWAATAERPTGRARPATA